MKKHLRGAAVIGLLMIAGGVGWARDWYVRPAGGLYGTADGTAYETAWDGLSKVAWGAGGVSPGDTLYVLGNHQGGLKQGDGVFTGAFSGLPGQVIHITGYHPSHPEDPGIIWAVQRTFPVGTVWEGPDSFGIYRLQQAGVASTLSYEDGNALKKANLNAV